MAKSERSSNKSLFNIWSYIWIVASVWRDINNYRKPLVIENMLQYGDDYFASLFENDNIPFSVIWLKRWEGSRSILCCFDNFTSVKVMKSNPYCVHSSKSSIFVYSGITSYEASSSFITGFIRRLEWEKLANSGVLDPQEWCYDEKKE